MAQLPPKRPQTITATTQLPQHWSPTAAAAVETQHSPLPHHGHHHNLNHPSWVDEFLDFTSVRRGTHRRSVSDSITFIDAAAAISADMPSLVELEINCSSSNNNNSNGANSGSSNNNCYNLGAFDKLDDEQLMSMFSSDDMSLSLPLPTASSNSNPSTPSDQNNNGNIDGEKPNERDQLVGMANNNNNNNNTSGYGDGGEVVDQSLLCKQEPQNEDSHLPNSSDRDFIVSDPKRVKRILANRQSAQRSRVRKLQYISELERTVTTLQTEVSALSPRVAFLDHQRLILTVDNSAIKQRIAALGQDKIFKDAHQEALKKEIERLRQIYEQQQQQHHQHNSHNGDINGHHHASVSAATPLPQLDIMQQRRVDNEHAAAATLIT